MIFASGLKYVGLQTTALGWMLCGLLFAAGATWLVFAQPWRAWMAPSDASELLRGSEPEELVGDPNP